MGMSAQDIAAALGESSTESIQKVIDVVGEQRAMEALAEAARIENRGGMMTASGRRRRTPGGVWFHLIRQSATVEERKLIWKK